MQGTNRESLEERGAGSGFRVMVAASPPYKKGRCLKDVGIAILSYRHPDQVEGSLLHCGNLRVCAKGKRCLAVVSHQAMSVLP